METSEITLNSLRLSKNREKIEDVQLDITDLAEFLHKNKDIISKIYYFKHPELCLVCGGNVVDFKDTFGTFELEEV